MRTTKRTPGSHRLLIWLISLGFSLSLLAVQPALNYADFVPFLAARSDKISDSTAGATVTHAFGFTYLQTSVQLGSVRFQFCSNSPLPEDT